MQTATHLSQICTSRPANHFDTSRSPMWEKEQFWFEDLFFIHHARERKKEKRFPGRLSHISRKRLMLLVTPARFERAALRLGI